MVALAVMVADVTAFAPSSLMPLRQLNSQKLALGTPPAVRSSRAAFGVQMAAAVDVEKLIEKAKSAKNPKAPKRIYKAVKKKSGAHSILLEFSRDEEVPEHKLDEISLNFRRGNVAAIVVDTTPEGGEEDLAKFVHEQQFWGANEFPGPCPVIWRGNVKGLETVAKASAAGAQGITIPVSDFEDGESLTELVRGCHALGMEAVVEVNDAAQITTAVDAGATTVCVRFESNVGASFLSYAAKALLPDIPDKIASLAAVKGRQGGPELEQTGVLVNEGFNGVLLTDFVGDCRDSSSIRYTKYILYMLASKRSKNLQINELKAGSYGYGAGAGFTHPSGWGGEGTHL